MPYTQKQIQDRYDKLPADIRQAIDSVDTTNKIVDIGEKNDLMYDQISELVDEVGLVMVGLTPETRFVTNIARRMQVDVGKAMLIAKDINKEIFDKMRQSLQKIEGMDEEGFSEESKNVEPEKQQPDQEVKTVPTDAERAEKKSVIDAVEKAGGFIIDKPDQAPLRAEKIVHDEMKESLESKKDIISVIEKESFEPSEETGAPLPPDHLLGDVPEPTGGATAPETIPAPKQPDQSSIVDTLLSKGVAIPIDSGTSKESAGPGPQKTDSKIRPYDGTDPYREPIE